MPDVRPDRQLNCRLVGLFGGGRSPDPTGVFSTGMFGNGLTYPAWTARIEVTDSTRKRVHVVGVELSPACGRALPGCRARLCIGEALLLRARKGGLPHENTLSLVPLPSTTKPNDDGA